MPLSEKAQKYLPSSCQDVNGLLNPSPPPLAGQVSKLEAKSAAPETSEEARRKYASVLIRANEMVESIKQA